MYYILVSGYILRDKDDSKVLRSLIKNGVIPIEQLMIESDAPYMGYKGCRNNFIKCLTEDNECVTLSYSKKTTEKNLPQCPFILSWCVYSSGRIN